MAGALEQTISSVWKREAAHVIGALARLLRDVSLAEEFAQDAFVIALEQWPKTGVPQNPGAWLMTTAKNRALNALKRSKRSERQVEAIETHVPLAELEAALEGAMDFEIGDEVLRLLFAACHPVLSKEARVALTLRMVGGLSTAEISRAFLTSEPTLAQRIVRAKKTLGDARVAFEIPRGDELAPRLSSVLEVVYLVFNEGYSATAGEDLMRPSLMHEARRLAHLLAALAPDEPEVHGLLGLIEFQLSRASARTDANGEPVLLTEQDRSLWDAQAIEIGFAAVARAEALTAQRGPYVLQAAIAACHARARSAAVTDWGRIAALYGELAQRVPSPVVELNRAIAVSRAEGPEAGLQLLDPLMHVPAMSAYHLLPSARADLLERLDRKDEARAEFLRAAGLAQNERQRERLRARAERLR